MPLSPTAGTAMTEPEPLPWEQPGAVRRDCEPHRGELLAKLAAVSQYAGAISINSCQPALLAFPLGVTVWLLARHDLKQMRRGTVDPTRRDLAEAARRDALYGMGLSAAPLALLTLLTYILLQVPYFP